MNQREVIDTAARIVHEAKEETIAGCEASAHEALWILDELLSFRRDPDVALGWWLEWLSK